MWIVALALRRPYTFVVMALVIILLMGVAVVRTPVDIFPTSTFPWSAWCGSIPVYLRRRWLTGS